MAADVFVHEKGLCESRSVGRGTRVWAFAHVLPGARIGADGNICDHVFIENDVIIGDRVTVKSGVQLWDGLRVEDDVFIGPNVTFTNDPFPRSKVRRERPAQTLLKAGCSIGANATILPGVTVGRLAMVGAGAVVTKSVPPHAIVTGNPAVITGYAKATGGRAATRTSLGSDLAAGVAATGVSGATLHHFPRRGDMRGDLCVGEVGKDVPFAPARFFLVFNVPNREVRGEHAHRQCHQFLVAAHGSVSVMVEDSAERADLLLDSPHVGLHVAPMVWCAQYRYSPDAVLLVLASRPYEPEDYIRDYEEYRDLVGRRG